MREVAGVLALFFAGLVQAAPVTIDFESVPAGTQTPLTIDGFLFDTPTSLWVPEVVGTPGNQQLSLQVGGVTDPFGTAGPIFST